MPTVLIGGGSGHLGSLLRMYLKKSGFEVKVVSRKFYNGMYFWSDLEKGLVKEHFDMFINLTGPAMCCLDDNLNKYFPGKKKDLIVDSHMNRIKTNKLMREAVEGQKKPPSLWMSLSSTDLYPSSSEVVYTEESLVERECNQSLICSFYQQLEDEHEIRGSRRSDVSSVLIRIGDIIGPKSTAFFTTVMSSTAYSVISDRLQSQFVSWIHIDDAISCILKVIELSKKRQINGAFNVVAPSSDCTLFSDIEVMYINSSKKPQITLTFPTIKRLTETLKRKVNIHIPHIAREKFSSNVRSYPKRLIDMDFHYKYPCVGSIGDDVAR